MKKIREIISKYAILRIPFKIIQVIKAFFVLWMPLILKKPSLIKFLYQWVISFRPKAEPYKEEVAWIPFEAIEWLNTTLKKNMKAFEWGSGGSTFFVANRVKEIISVEHNPKWYSLFSGLLKKKNVSNCRYLLKQAEVSDTTGDVSSFENYRSKEKWTQNMIFKEYCQAIDYYPDNNFDFVFIDGRARPSCMARAIKKIKPGGYLMLDDSERQRYAKARELLKNWKCKEFFGPKPYVISLCHTTVWQKTTS